MNTRKDLFDLPYATNPEDGIKIYYEVEGTGPPLLLYHGLPGTHRAWKDRGYVEALRNRFRLILLDWRGFGDSDKPYASDAYSLSIMASDAVTVLDELDIDRAHLFGYSMGGRVSYGVAAYAPERLLSLVVGGMHPLAFTPEWQQFLISMRGPIQKLGMQAWVAAEEQLNGPLPDAHRNRILATDTKALLALAESSFWDDALTVDDLGRFPFQCLLFCGTDDEFVGGHSIMQSATNFIPDWQFVSLPELNHNQAIERSDLVLPYLLSFWERVTKVAA